MHLSKLYFSYTVYAHVNKPHAAGYFAIVTDANKFVGRRDCMQISCFLVGKKCVRYPHVAKVFRTDR